MPLVPIDIPSLQLGPDQGDRNLTPIVLNWYPMSPAFCTPSFTFRPSDKRCMLHGFPSYQLPVNHKNTLPYTLIVSINLFGAETWRSQLALLTCPPPSIRSHILSRQSWRYFWGLTHGLRCSLRLRLCYFSGIFIYSCASCHIPCGPENQFTSSSCCTIV